MTLRAAQLPAARWSGRWLASLALSVVLLFLFRGTASFAGRPFPLARKRAVLNGSRQNSKIRLTLQFQRELTVGRRKMRAGDYRGAAFYFGQAARLNPASSDAKRLLRMAWFEQQYRQGLNDLVRHEPNRAQSSFQRALRIASNSGAQAQTNLASLQLSLMAGTRFIESGSYQAAAQSFARALALSPNDPKALAGLTEARFHVAFQAGLAALSRGALDLARRRFRECLVYQPGSAAALQQIERINKMEIETAQFDQDFQAANTAIDTGAWNRADSEIKSLGRIMEEAEELGIYSPAIFRSGPLLPAYLSYAFGDFDGAFRLAQRARGEEDSDRAAKFREFLRARLQSHDLRASGPVLLGAYLLTLVLSIYVGLRRVARAPEKAAAEPSLANPSP